MAQHAAAPKAAHLRVIAGRPVTLPAPRRAPEPAVRDGVWIFEAVVIAILAGLALVAFLYAITTFFPVLFR